jgi:hypothetical protein
MVRMVRFTAIALAAVSVDQDLGRYVVAAGWFGHAAGFSYDRATNSIPTPRSRISLQETYGQGRCPGRRETQRNTELGLLHSSTVRDCAVRLG